MLDDTRVGPNGDESQSSRADAGNMSSTQAGAARAADAEARPMAEIHAPREAQNHPSLLGEAAGAPRDSQSERPSSRRSVTFGGPIRRVPFRLVGNWQIGAKIVMVTPRTLIEGTAGVGYDARVVAEEDVESGLRALKIEVQHPALKPEPPLGYLTNLFGLLAAASLLLPLILFIFPYLPGYSRPTVAITELFCLGFFGFVFMERRGLYTSWLRKSVRGAGGPDLIAWSYLILAAAFIVGFVAALGILVDLREALGDALGANLARLFILPFQVFVFVGITFAFSILGSITYMAELEKMGAYHRPIYLKPTVDLVSIGMQTVEENLAIPPETEWKIIERKRQPGGGVWFTVSWTETFLREAQNGSVKAVVEEKEYEVVLSVSGQLVSLTERYEQSA